MAKKKSAKAKNTRPLGSPPLWTDELRNEFGLAYYSLLMRIDTLTKQYHEYDNTNIPSGLIAAVRALCCLLRSHPLWPRNNRFEKRQVATWREIIEADLEVTQKKIPVNHRKDFVDCVKADLDFLDEYMTRKREPQNDTW